MTHFVDEVDEPVRGEQAVANFEPGGEIGAAAGQGVGQVLPATQ
jgi:hypothetical protein